MSSASSNLPATLGAKSPEPATSELGAKPIYGDGKLRRSRDARAAGNLARKSFRREWFKASDEEGGSGKRSAISGGPPTRQSTHQTGNRDGGGENQVIQRVM